MNWRHNTHTEKLFRDYDLSKEKAEDFDSMLEQNQILCLSAVKWNNSLFKFYTNLPSYEVFCDLFQYLEQLACDMLYVQQLGKDHQSVKKLWVVYDLWYSGWGLNVELVFSSSICTLCIITDMYLDYQNKWFKQLGL